MGNEVLKIGNGIEVMQVDSQFFHVLSILKYNCDPFLVSLVMIFVVNSDSQHYLRTDILWRPEFSDYALGFLIMRVPKSDAQRNICLVSGIYFI
jgi:hypothetical protein